MVAEDQNIVLTYTDAAKVAGVSHTTIGKWVRDHGLRPARMPGSTRQRIRKSTLLEYLDSLESDDDFETFASSES